MVWQYFCNSDYNIVTTPLQVICLNVTRRRRLEIENTGNREEGGVISPIPQIDGLSVDLGEWEEDNGSGVKKQDIANLLGGMREEINQGPDSFENFEEEDDSNNHPNEYDDNFEDVKFWALAQKKPVQLLFMKFYFCNKGSINDKQNKKYVSKLLHKYHYY